MPFWSPYLSWEGFHFSSELKTNFSSTGCPIYCVKSILNRQNPPSWSAPLSLEGFQFLTNLKFSTNPGALLSVPYIVSGSLSKLSYWVSLVFCPIYTDPTKSAFSKPSLVSGSQWRKAFANRIPPPRFSRNDRITFCKEKDIDTLTHTYR